MKPALPETKVPENKCLACNGTGIARLSDEAQRANIKRGKVSAENCPACGGTGREPKKN